MKQIIICLAVLVVFLCGCKALSTPEQPPQSEISQTEPSNEAGLSSADSSKVEMQSSSLEQSLPPSLSNETESSLAIDEISQGSVAEVSNTATISIIFEDKAIVGPTVTEVFENDSVFDLLERVSKLENTQLDFSGFGKTVYVKGIANIYEFDAGPESGWMFRVNGNFSSVGCGKFKVKAGDIIEWLYTKNMGEDIGAVIG